MEQPLVSVTVITYNSSKTVLETLDSIKAQTYQNIELIVSDDCSTDNTIEICRNWIEQNKDRFACTKLLTIDKNTGVSANLNRAEAACQGVWVKGVAGDDMLMPNCVQNCIEYVTKHPDTIYLFGRIEVFGSSPEHCRQVENVFDYSFFSWTIEQQYERLVFGDNLVPAATVFYNRKRVVELGITNDERIPLLEDWPKWIVCLKKGVCFHFIDEVLVRYRLGGLSTGRSICAEMSERKFASRLLFDCYYRYQKWLERDYDVAIERIVKENVEIYGDILKSKHHAWQLYQNVLNSHAYRLGRALLRPLKWIKNELKRVKS